MIIQKSVNTIFGFIYAVSAEYFHIFNVIPTVFVFSLFFSLLLFPLRYLTVRNRKFLEIVDEKSKPIEVQAEKDIEKLKSDGYADDSDDILKVEIIRDRKLKKIKKSYIFSGARYGLTAASLICVCLSLATLHYLPDALPRLSYIFRNLTEMISRYRLEKKAFSVLHARTSASMALALYEAVPSKWAALSKAMPNLDIVVQGVRKGMLNVCGIGTVSLGSSSTALLRDGKYAPLLLSGILCLLYIVPVAVQFGKSSKTWSTTFDKVYSIIFLLVHIAITLWVTLDFSLLTVIFLISFNFWNRITNILCRKISENSYQKKIKEGV